MPSCNAEDFVLYFFLCFRSLRDRAPASDAGSGGSSPFGSIFYCKSLRNITPAVSFLESTLSLGSGLAVLAENFTLLVFCKYRGLRTAFLKGCSGGYSGIATSFEIRIFFQSNSHCPVFEIFLFIENSFPNRTSLSYHPGYFIEKILPNRHLCSIG